MNSNFLASVANDNACDNAIRPSLSAAQNHYLNALRHILRMEDDKADLALNAARRCVLADGASKGDERHWSSLTTADLQRIMPDLTAARFAMLYSDQPGTAGGPWSLPTMMVMVGNHLATLGTTQDLYDFNLFLQTMDAPNGSRGLMID